MHPELFPSLHIRAYSFFLLSGFFAGYLLFRWRLKYIRIEGRHADNLALILIVASLLGAKLFSRLFYQPSVTSFWEALKLWRPGGLVFYGGLVFGVVSVVLYSLIMRVSLMELADGVAPSLALGLAFGRVGCYLIGCCWGDVCARPEQLSCITNSLVRFQVQTIPILSGPDFPLAVSFPSNSYPYQQHLALGLIGSQTSRSLPVHPVQLYEAGLALLLCFLLNIVFEKRRYSGEIFCLFGLVYGTIRFGLEFLRAGNPLTYWGMSISQVISVILAGICAALFFGRRWLLNTIPKQFERAAPAGSLAETPSQD